MTLEGWTSHKLATGFREVLLEQVRIVAAQDSKDVLLTPWNQIPKKTFTGPEAGSVLAACQGSMVC